MPPAERPRFGNRDAVVRVGARHRPLGDVYHYLMRAPWSTLLLGIAVAWIAANALFACAYLALGDALHGSNGSFSDAFFFSVQTMATIGYGKMTPSTLGANLLVSGEALFGLLSTALVTGLIFAKFSRPTARVMFSRVAVIAPHEGVPALMFRMANERGNQIVEARLRVIVVKNERTAEGASLRRMRDLALVRADSPLFALTWMAIHSIDDKSPLHGFDASRLADDDCQLVITLAGSDETLSQTIHARHTYLPGEIVWNARFADVISPLPGGRRQIDYTKFHDVVSLEA